MAELKDLALSLKYPSGAMIFSESDREKLFCNPDRDEARAVKNLTKSIGFPKVEKELSGLKK